MIADHAPLGAKRTTSRVTRSRIAERFTQFTSATNRSGPNRPQYRQSARKEQGGRRLRRRFRRLQLARGLAGGGSDVVVERVFARGRPQADVVDLLLALVLDPSIEQLGSEHVALEQEGMILL